MRWSVLKTYPDMSLAGATALPIKPIDRHCKQNVNAATELFEPLRSQLMDDVRIITLDSLLCRLEEVLGHDSLLYHRFEQGLRLEDERCLTDAMSSLRLYPGEVRRLVEDTVMSWLFGARSDARVGLLEAAPYA